MMTNTVEYILNLKNNLSGGLQQADMQAKKLETTLVSVKSMLSTIGISFGIFQVVSMMQQGTEKAHELHLAIAQVKAGLESTQGAAGVTFSELEKSAKQFSSASTYGRAELMKMQSVLLTFPKVGKASFDPATQAIMDMATRMDMDLSHAAIMVGKALQDPVTGVMMMRRVGVNFTKEQVEGFKKMVDAGDLYGAQVKILQELQTEFGGSAKAAFEADPLSKYNKAIGSMKLMLGEVAISVQKALAPALIAVVNGLKATVKWIGEHKVIVMAVVGALAGYASVAAVATLATKGLAAVQFLYNAALTANPIGLVVAAIAALIAGVVTAWNKFEGFRKAILGVWEVIKAFASTLADVAKGVFQIFKGIFTLDLGTVKEGLKQVITTVGEAGQKIGEAWKKGQDKGAASFAASQAKKSLIPGTKAGAGLGGLADVNQAGMTQIAGTKAEGQKNINITISYNAPLIKEFTISTTNVKEGLGSLKDKLTEILTGATHDAMAVANY